MWAPGGGPNAGLPRQDVPDGHGLPQQAPPQLQQQPQLIQPMQNGAGWEPPSHPQQQQQLQPQQPPPPQQQQLQPPPPQQLQPPPPQQQQLQPPPQQQDLLPPGASIPGGTYGQPQPLLQQQQQQQPQHHPQPLHYPQQQSEQPHILHHPPPPPQQQQPHQQPPPPPQQQQPHQQPPPPPQPQQQQYHQQQPPQPPQQQWSGHEQHGSGSSGAPPNPPSYPPDTSGLHPMSAVRAEFPLENFPSPPVAPLPPEGGSATGTVSGNHTGFMSYGDPLGEGALGSGSVRFDEDGPQEPPLPPLPAEEAAQQQMVQHHYQHPPPQPQQHGQYEGGMAQLGVMQRAGVPAMPGQHGGASPPPPLPPPPHHLQHHPPPLMEARRHLRFKRAKRPSADAYRVRSIDDYDKRRVIGNGTFGQVWEAVDRRDAAPVAIKLVKMEREIEGVPITALREIRLLQSLQHPNIVHLKEVVKGGRGETDPSECASLHMVFEYVENDLAGLLEMGSADRDLTPKRIKTYMRDLLEGMHYMHSKNILHRDLKCANLLISRDGVLKIADWGLARIISSHPGAPYTQKVITLWYRPPELLMSSKHYSFAVDMWSAGCIFGEMVSRQPLLPGKEEPDQLEKIFQLCGTPTLESWPSMVSLPDYQSHRYRFENAPCRPTLRERMAAPFAHHRNGLSLIEGLLSLDPDKRLKASDAREHMFFTTPPLPAVPGELPQLSGSGYHEHQAKQESRRRTMEAAQRRQAPREMHDQQMQHHMANVMQQQRLMARGPAGPGVRR